jgi:formate hydrogenlyase transcriptional activator
MHFVEKFGRRLGKTVKKIPATTMSAFASYEWPGNIRELQNVIERAMILSDGDVLPNPLPIRRLPAANPLLESQRTLILQTLDEVGWVIGGPKGAAAQLRLPRTTLISKMKSLGISREQADRQQDTDLPEPLSPNFDSRGSEEGLENI